MTLFAGEVFMRALHEFTFVRGAASVMTLQTNSASDKMIGISATVFTGGAENHQEHSRSDDAENASMIPSHCAFFPSKGNHLSPSFAILFERALPVPIRRSNSRNSGRSIF